MSFASFAFEIGPELAHYVQRPHSAPIVVLGHVFGGIGTLAALHFAREFVQNVESIALAGVVDADDQGGPASQADFVRLTEECPSALIRRDGLWRWVGGQEALRQVVDVGGVMRQAQALPLLDVVSLAAALDARSLRVDFAGRDKVSGKAPSTELLVEIAGEGRDGEPVQARYELVDGDVYANLSAHGAALATERLLGLAGGPRRGRGCITRRACSSRSTCSAACRSSGCACAGREATAGWNARASIGAGEPARVRSRQRILFERIRRERCDCGRSAPLSSEAVSRSP
ncbi:hypothetical protein [Nannocystis pusilla]|uniref:hypothetical protein n=1 Tax=Nannocystis pusilla TaxID=889268 RepID=UPI003B7A8D8F